jgi:hypothetical protein
VPERQLTFSYGLGGIQQRFVDIFPRQVWVLGIDLAPEPLYEEAKAHPLAAA